MTKDNRTHEIVSNIIDTYGKYPLTSRIDESNMLNKEIIIEVAEKVRSVLFPGFFVGIFSSDAALMQAGPAALNLYFFGFFFMGFQSSGQSAFQALGDARHAIFFSLFRKVIIVVPLTLLLPALGMGVDGVFMAEPISNLVGGLACFITMMLTVYRRMGQEQPAGQ